MCFWALSAYSCFLTDDCWEHPCWSTAAGCCGTQQTSHLLLKDPDEIYFHHHANWLSCVTLHLPQEQKPQNLKESQPVLNTIHIAAWFRAFEVKKILLCLAEDFFLNHILCYWLYWSEPVESEKGTGRYDVVFPLWDLLCMRNHLYFCNITPTEKICSSLIGGRSGPHDSFVCTRHSKFLPKWIPGKSVLSVPFQFFPVRFSLSLCWLFKLQVSGTGTTWRVFAEGLLVANKWLLKTLVVCVLARWTSSLSDKPFSC